MGKHVLVQLRKVRRRHGLVVIPPDLLLRGFIADHEFVFWGTAGVLACQCTKRTVGGQLGLAASNRFFVKPRLGQIISNAGDTAQSDCFQTDCRVVVSKNLHRHFIPCSGNRH